MTPFRKLVQSWWQSARTLEGQGLLGALLVYLAFGLSSLYIVPRFRPFDELRNVAYAYEVSHGRLPRIPDDLPHASLGTKPLRSSDFHASAQHPPLYYALVGVPVRAAVAGGDLPLAVRLARIMTLVMGAGALIYIHRLARLLAPRLPGVAVVTAGVFASLPVVTNTFSIVYNDALATLAAAAMLHATLTILLHGATRRRLLIAGLWLALSSLTRFAALLVDAIGLLAVFAAAFVHGSEASVAQRVKRGLSWCVPLGLAVLVASGWFYVRNIVLYGDPTGAKILFELLDRPNRGSPISFVLSPSYWLELHDIIWGHMVGGGRYMRATGVTLARAFSVLALLALSFTLVRFRRPLRERLTPAHAVAVALLLLVFFVVCAPALAFHAKGGTLMARYCLPAAFVPALMAAFAVTGTRSPLPAQALLTGYALLALSIYDLYALDLIDSAKARDLSLVLAMTRQGIPGEPLVCVVLVALASGIALMVNALAGLHRRVDLP